MWENAGRRGTQQRPGLGKVQDHGRKSGGDLSYIEDPDRFDVAAFSREIRAPKAGYITSMQTEQIGVAAGVLGAGREKKDSKVDYSAGILVYKKNWRLCRTGRCDGCFIHKPGRVTGYCR